MSSNLTHVMGGHTTLPKGFHSQARADDTHFTGGSGGTGGPLRHSLANRETERHRGLIPEISRL